MTFSPQQLPALNLSNHSVTRMRQRVVTASDIDVLASRGYKLKYKLGEGSYAKVYYAEPLSDENIVVACKIINTNNAPSEYANKFLPRELAVITRLSHPNIVFIHFILRRGPRFFVFMRWAEQGDLLDYVLNNGPLTEEHSRFWFHQIMVAIQYLHYLNIAHRDLKCENVLITANNNLKLADFGFTRVTTDINGRPIKSSTYCGSLSYAAPEILRNKPYHPMPVDLWAAGVLFYIMLNKSLPFTAMRDKYILQLQLAKKWKMKTKPGMTFTEEVVDLLSNLLEPDPVLRFTADKVLGHIWFQSSPFFEGLNEAQQAAMARSEKLRMELRQELGRRTNSTRKSRGTVEEAASKLSEVKSQDVFTAVKEAAAANNNLTLQKSKQPEEEKEKIELSRERSTVDIQTNEGAGSVVNRGESNQQGTNAEGANSQESKKKSDKKSGKSKRK